MLRDAQEERRKVDILIAQTENQLSLTILELEKWRGNVQHAKENVEQMKKEHNDFDFEANTINDEIEKLKSATKNRLILLDVLHKQLEEMIEKLGGKEMNLKEIQVCKKNLKSQSKWFLLNSSGDRFRKENLRAGWEDQGF